MSAASIYATAKTVECPKCWAAVGERCGTKTRRARASRPHQIRLDAAARLAAGLKNDPIGRKK